MIPRKPWGQRVSLCTCWGAVLVGLLLLSLAPKWTDAQNAEQPALAPSDQKVRDLERRIEKLEAGMDDVSDARNIKGRGTFRLLTTVRARRTLDRSVHALRLDTNVGNIKVMHADGAELMVEAVVRVKTSVDIEKTNREFDHHVRIAQAGEVLSIADAHKDALDHDAWSVALKIAIPRPFPITARTGVGDVEVELASGAVSLSTGVGNLTLQADRVAAVIGSASNGNATLHLGTVTDRLEVTAGTGNVTLELKDPGSRADVTLTTGTGDLKLGLPAEPIGRFDLKSAVGSISLGGLRGIQVTRHLVGASASAELGERGPHYKLHTGVGSITTTVRN